MKFKSPKITHVTRANVGEAIESLKKFPISFVDDAFRTQAAIDEYLLSEIRRNARKSKKPARKKSSR